MLILRRTASRAKLAAVSFRQASGYSSHKQIMADLAQPLRIAGPDQLARANIEFTRLATSSIDQNAGARHLAVLELERTNTELERRLAERTLERDDAARERALVELGRSNAELKLRLTERTLERDDWRNVSPCVRSNATTSRATKL